MLIRKNYICPTSFTEEEVPDADERKIMQDGLDAMTRSTTELVEFCIAQRQKQYLLVIRESMKGKKK